MNENDNILTVLAELEQNLQEINSARQQVTDVVQSSQNLADVIASYKSSFEGLSFNVSQVLEKNRTLSLNVLSELSNLTMILKDEMSKLSKFDYDLKFQLMQQEIVRQIERSLSERLANIDFKMQALLESSNQFQKQNERFEQNDLDSYIEEHQKAFNELFSYLAQQDKRQHSRFVAMEDQLAEIDRQNGVLKSEIKINRIIYALGVVIIVASMIIMHWFSRP